MPALTPAQTLSEEERKLVSLCVARCSATSLAAGAQSSRGYRESALPELTRARSYGGRMPQKKGPLHKTLQTRKYFDSGDYVLSKEGKATGTGVEHPQPESIPHVTSPTTGVNGIGSASLSGTSPTNASTSPIKVRSTMVRPGAERSQESGLAKEPELADPNSSMVCLSRRERHLTARRRRDPEPSLQIAVVVAPAHL